MKRFIIMALALCFASTASAKSPFGLQLHLGASYLPTLISNTPSGTVVQTIQAGGSADLGFLQVNMWNFALNMLNIPYFYGSGGMPVIGVTTPSNKEKLFWLQHSFFTLKYYPSYWHSDWLKWYGGFGLSVIDTLGNGFSKAQVSNDTTQGYLVLQLGTEIPLSNSWAGYLDVKKSWMSMTTNPEYGSITIEQPWYISAGLTWAIGKRSWGK